MEYSDISKYLPSAVHIYAGVTPEEQDAIVQDTWVVNFDGVIYIGSTTPIITLNVKELISGPSVVVVPQPAIGEFQTAHMSVVQDPVDGLWKQVWTIVNTDNNTIKAVLQERITAKRWDVETGGLVLGNGMSVNTTIADQNRITSVVLNAQRMNIASVDFKGAAGWVTLPLASVVAIADAITTHVQACFTAEKAHYDAIIAIVDTDTQTTYDQLAAYDVNAGWPSN